MPTVPSLPTLVAPQSPPTPPISEPMPSSIPPELPKAFLKWIIIGIILLLLAATSVFAYKLILRNKVTTPPEPTSTASAQPTPTPQTINVNPSPTPDPTANWKIYTNTKYKFELKYPTNLPSFKTKIIGTSDKPFYVIRESFSSENFGTDYGIEIDIWDNPSESTLKAWLESMKNAQALALPTENFNLTPNYAINGKEALRFWLDPVSKGQEPGKCVQSCPINNVYVAFNDKVYRILFGFSREVNDEDLIILNQILSTFQFME